MPYIDRIQQLRAAEVYVLMIILLEWPKTKTCQQHVQYYKVHGHRHSVRRHCPCPNAKEERERMIWGEHLC